MSFRFETGFSKDHPTFAFCLTMKIIDGLLYFIEFQLLKFRAHLDYSMLPKNDMSFSSDAQKKMVATVTI